MPYRLVSCSGRDSACRRALGPGIDALGASEERVGQWGHAGVVCWLVDLQRETTVMLPLLVDTATRCLEAGSVGTWISSLPDPLSVAT
jgi:hypothetical protein